MRVLYITYNGLTEPLGQHQVLPYLLGLASRGWRYEVVSFEKADTADPGTVARVRGQLREQAIRWSPLRYHRSPTLPATAYDALRGVVTGLLADRQTVLIHARSTLPATIAQSLARLRRLPWIFDVRGLLAQEYADAGHWDRGGGLFRLTERVEAGLLARADGLVFLTERIRRALVGERNVVPASRPTSVIPCAVDTNRFKPDHLARERIRTELALGEHPVLIYAGSLGSWYRLEEMLDFYQVAREQRPGLRFLVLTMNPEVASEAVTARDLRDSVIVIKAKPEQVPTYLAAADAGICFLGDCLSKQASSPTKYAEYLGTGLPVITNGWTGDAALFARERPWLLVNGFGSAEYRAAAKRLCDLLADPEGTRRAARALAERAFSLDAALDRYDALYRSVVGPGAKGADTRVG